MEPSSGHSSMSGIGATLRDVEGGAVWLLEDSPVDAERARKLLSAYSVRVFPDGAALLETLAQEPAPDVLVLDWELPGMSGLDVCRFVRRTLDRLALPIVMMTGHADNERVVEAFDAGANDYVTKPYRGAELAARVHSAIRTRRLFVTLVTTHAHLERERVRVADSEAKYRRLADAGVIGVVEMDLDGGVTDANDMFLSLVGATRADLATGRLRHLPHCRPLDDRALRELIETGVTSQYEKELTRFDGAAVVVRVAAARVGPRGDRCVGYVLDVTHERQVEADRARLFEAERRARTQAELASRMKDDFLAIVSHELRTPMNAILGWAGILGKTVADRPEATKAVDVIRRNARAQAKLIEDILDVSRVVTGKVRLEPSTVDLGAVVEQAVEAVRPTADAKGILIRRELEDGGEPLFVDPTRMQQVIWNLLSNAVKFTPRGGTVTIRTTSDEETATVSVSDTGPGIAPEHLVSIFERFRQIDGSTTRRHGGLGLGLAIVRHLVELHGGTVRAYSDGDQTGATFVVRVPKMATIREETPTPDSVRGEPPPSSLRPSASLDGLHVVLVDDDTDSRTFASSILRDAGARVVECASVTDALSAIHAERPDVVVSDIAMPEADGFTLVREIRSMSRELGGATPCIALTAYARDEDAARSLDAGFQRHLTKPLDGDALVQAVFDCAGTASNAA
jgi:PAS domain S-box-containing protein